MSSLETNKGSGLLDSFNKIGALLVNQKESVNAFDSANAYGSKPESNFDGKIVTLYESVFEMLNIANEEGLEDWKFQIGFKNDGIVDSGKLYGSLRLLPDGDIRKLRLFNRFVGQQMFDISVGELFEYQKRYLDKVSNPFWKTFCSQAIEFAALNEVKFELIEWPIHPLSQDERKVLSDQLQSWREKFVSLPAIALAIDFFKTHEQQAFNSFFHIQRQFDSESWKDFNKDGEPFPQPLPRIAGYRKAITDVHSEFDEAEGSISMCFDYCKLSPAKVVLYIRTAEDAFLKIVNRLDDEYPIAMDYSHTQLHDHAKEIKHMMFPLRCVFFEELEAERSSKDATDNTLDSYMDMTLGKTNVSLPPAYIHDFKITGLEIELQEPILKVLGGMSKDTEISTNLLLEKIQSYSPEQNEAFSEVFSGLSDKYEVQFKSDENNLSRRIARLSFLFSSAVAKKDIIGKASQERLDTINELANEYASKAEKFSGVDVDDDNAVKNLTEDQLPIMASPQQLEDLYHTQKVVGRLADSDGEFKETANQIEEGLLAAMDMMKKAERLMVKMVNRIFPLKDDSKDLLDGIHGLIDLGYKTQQLLADIDKKESQTKKKETKKAQNDLLKLKQELEDNKKGTAKLQMNLLEVLKSKNDLIAIMRVTQSEKDLNKNQLRMITKMTINSMQS